MNVYQPIQAPQTIPASTLDPPSLVKELREANAALGNFKEGQNSQTLLNASPRHGERVQGRQPQGQRVGTATKAAPGSRKPSRGHQKPLQQTGDKGLQATSKLVFSTPALTADNSAAALPMGSVTFHPHPLNNNVYTGNHLQLTHHTLGGGTAKGTSSAIGARQQPTVESARPHSQKQPLGSGSAAVNNRNSRKNLRPLGKKASQSGNAHAAGAQAQKGNHKVKNASRQQYATQQASAASAQPQTKQNNHGQASLGLAGLVASNGSLHLQLLQNDMSASTSRERALALGGMHFGSTVGAHQFVTAQASGSTAGKDNYQSNVASLAGETANITNKNVLFKFKKNS